VKTDAVVFVVDDDQSVRDALSNLIRSIGLQAQTFDSGRDFLSYERPDGAACLVLDVRLPGLSGLDLQRELAAAGEQIPIIFITGHGDIPMTVRAMKAGAAESWSSRSANRTCSTRFNRRSRKTAKSANSAPSFPRSATGMRR
jgi:FixJ family two-component response regulator